MSSPDSALHDLPNALVNALLNPLDDALQKTQAHLVILDPWDGLWEVDLDRASQTRPLLYRRGRLAELHRCCILLIRHLAKPTVGRPVHRGRAFMECSAARLPNRRRRQFPLDGPQQPHPEALLAPRPTGAGLPKRKFAAQWLRDCLQPGSQTQGSIEIPAERDGVCIATLRRAKFDIGVRSSKDGKSGAWWWTLPPPED